MNHVKKFLNRALGYDKMVNILKNELKEKQKELDNINIVYSEVRASIVKSLAEEKAIRLVELEEEIKAYEEKRDKAIKEIREVINKLDDEIHRKILELRYIDCMNWKDIAKMFNYSYNHMFKIHSKVLKKISKILKVDSTG